MFDVVTYALVKKLVGQAATGITNVEFKDGKLIFTLADGSTLETPLDISSGVAGASLNEEGALVIEFSDGTSLTYAAARKEDLQEVAEKVDILGENLENLTISHNTLIDDNGTSDNRVWSSQKIIDALTIEATKNGTNMVSFDSIGATRFGVKVEISNAPIQIQATLNGEEVVDYSVPINGTYYLDTGLFIMEDGTETTLADHYIVAAQGSNILEITNVDSIEVTYRTISKQSGGGVTDFDLIHGGFAKEEA